MIPQACSPQTEADVMTVGSPGNVVSRHITPSAQRRTAAQPSQPTAAPGKCPFTPYQASSADGCQKKIKGALDQTNLVRGVSI